MKEWKLYKQGGEGAKITEQRREGKRETDTERINKSMRQNKCFITSHNAFSSPFIQKCFKGHVFFISGHFHSSLDKSVIVHFTSSLPFMNSKEQIVLNMASRSD